MTNNRGNRRRGGRDRAFSLTLDEIRSIGFVFGCTVVAFWVVTAVAFAVLRPGSPPPAPNLGIVSIIAGLVLQQAFKRNGATDGDDATTDAPSEDVVPGDVARDARKTDEGTPPRGINRRRWAPHRRAVPHPRERLCGPAPGLYAS